VFAWLRLVGLGFAPLPLERAEAFFELTALLRRDAADFEPFGAREERDEALRDAPPPCPEDRFALGLEPDPFADPLLRCALLDVVLLAILDPLSVECPYLA
jgi:hypothetical protein